MMTPGNVHRFENGMVMSTDSELERWRAETLFEKEPETIRWLNCYAKQGGVFYDVGANVGGYSIYSAYNNKDISVCSFEPVTNNYAALLKNRELNGLRNIIPFQLALSSENGIKNIYIRDSRVGNSGAQLGAPIDERSRPYEYVYKEVLLCLKLDTLIQEYRLQSPTFLKIDVDGNELDILRGAQHMLRMSDLKSILIESNGEDKLREIDSMLTGYGFTADDVFNMSADHSSVRRKKSADNIAMNVVYSR